MNIRRSRATLLLLIAALSGLVPTLGVHAQHDHQQGHRHAASSAAVVNLQLDGTKKWSTDAPLRSGMAAIRAAFDADHPAIHAGRETDAQYAALADRIASQVDAIVASCKLPPQADANLHYVIADLMQGASLMRGEDPQRTRHDGAALVHGALDAYGRYFDDPGWKP